MWCHLKGGSVMVCEYTDIKNLSHRVEHQVIQTDDAEKREQLLEELYRVMTRPGKKHSA